MKKNNRLLKVLIVISLIALPILFFLYSYSLYHRIIYSKLFIILTLIDLVISLLLILLLSSKGKINLDTKILLFVSIGLSILGLGVDNLLYGTDSSFRNYLIEHSMSSISYKFIAEDLYPDTVIEKVLNNKKQVIDLSNDKIDFKEVDKNKTLYLSKEEEELFTNKNGELYKRIEVEGTNFLGKTFRGYLVIVYDPSHVTLSISPYVGEDRNGTTGQGLTTLSKNVNALIAMNASGFYDPNWNSNGGIPHGPLIHEGKIVTNFRRGIASGGLVGITYDNKLVLNNWTAEEAVENDIRDAVDWGPFLIVNGYNYYKDKDEYWTSSRTVIGQRKDGCILMLVISQLPSFSAGATYKDVATLMEKYGAINAAVMDSGTSTSMTENHEHVMLPYNTRMVAYRALPDAWVVTNEKNDERKEEIKEKATLNSDIDE